MRAHERDNKGRFAPGNPGGPGRPPAVLEGKYLETLGKQCSENDWRDICQRAVKDAKRGDYRARDWLSRYLLGAPERGAMELHAHLHNNFDRLDEVPFPNASVDDIIAAKVALDRLDHPDAYVEQGKNGVEDQGV